MIGYLEIHAWVQLKRSRKNRGFFISQKEFWYGASNEILRDFIVFDEVFMV